MVNGPISTPSSVPGLTLPTVQASAAGNPNASAHATMVQRSASQAALANAVGGKNKRGNHSKRGGAGATIQVPQFSPSQDTSGANGLIAGNAQTSTQSAANAKYDAHAMKKGGKNPNWSWGCSSGGRRRKSRTNKKRKSRTNKKRKTRRNKK